MAAFAVPSSAFGPSRRRMRSPHHLEISNMMEWIPVVLVIFKVLVLGTGMFFAIKWHYDRGKKEKGKRAAQRAIGEVAVIFVLGLVGLGVFTFFLLRMVGWDLPFP
jgi:heme/copper-type cytochrome/quinol oxidase subunit 2